MWGGTAPRPSTLLPEVYITEKALLEANPWAVLYGHILAYPLMQISEFTIIADAVPDWQPARCK